MRDIYRLKKIKRENGDFVLFVLFFVVVVFLYFIGFEAVEVCASYL